MSTVNAMAPPPTLTAAERTRLVRILGMLGSSFKEERDSAALAATKFLTDRRLIWSDVIPLTGSQGMHYAYRPEPPPPPKGSPGWQEDLAFCLRHLAELEDWPADFAISISRRRKTLTSGQAAKLAEIASDLRRQGFA